MRGKSAVWSALTLVSVLGCNTDILWDSEQRLQAPTTRIDMPEGINLQDVRITDAQEVDLVERVLTHRAIYHRSLTALKEYYRSHGYETKRIWAAQELAELNRVKPFRYILSGEIPSERLTPTDSIPEADELFDRARALMAQGGHSVPAVYRRSKIREALALLRELIETYPTSDKIDDAAFFCGEMHKEYFKGEEPLAVRWYERAFQWDPATPHPARFAAAAVYDLRLHDRDRALELYRAAIEHESWNKSNVSFAMRRIEKLTEPREPDVRSMHEDEAAAFVPNDAQDRDE